MRVKMSARAAEKLFLGLDISTQQVKCICVDSTLCVVHESAVKYVDDLPHYRTQDGVHIHADQMTVTAPVLMWLEAIDLCLERMRLSGFDFSQVVALSGSGQDSFSVSDSPIWMDASTTPQCGQLEASVGGAQKLAQITGSRAYERFTGNQIAKIFTSNLNAYNNTERISLVSSFGTSIFIGRYASIDLSDGSGMNLLDIKAHDWSTDCLNACAPGLREKLGPVTDKTAEPIAKYFVDRYGFSPECSVVTFTGDNPASLTGLCQKRGESVISLGSSDTLFLWVNDCIPTEDGHIYVNPIDRTQYMALLGFKNGSLMREKIQKQVAGGSWDKFNQLLQKTPMANNGNIGFYFDVVEIQPLVSGVYRFDSNNQLVEYCAGSRILATGGASCNQAILQVMADVFNVPVYTCDVANSASLGAAYRAKHGNIMDPPNTSETSTSSSTVMTVSLLDLLDHELADHPTKPTKPGTQHSKAGYEKAVKRPDSA